MDFRFSEEQQAIGEMAQRLFADLCTDERMLAHDRSGEPYDHELWGKLVETGLAVLLVGAEAGGAGLGMTDLLPVLQAQGGAVAPAPLWRHQLAVAAVERYAATSPLLAAAVTGESLATLSLDAGLQARGPSLRARPHPDGWQLSGCCPAVSFAAQAQWAIVGAEATEGTRLFIVDLTTNLIRRIEGVYTHREPAADIVFTDLVLPQSAALPAAAYHWLEQRALAAVAALQLGVSEAQLRRTAAYITERKQFDRAIATFQAAQMQMADGYIQVEALRTSLFQLCYRLDTGLDATPQALATRYLAGEAGHRIGHMAQHLHGGMGVDISYPIHRYQLWSRALGMCLGGAGQTLTRLGEWLASDDRLGWKYDLEELPAL